AKGATNEALELEESITPGVVMEAKMEKERSVQCGTRAWRVPVQHCGVQAILSTYALFELSALLSQATLTAPLVTLPNMNVSRRLSQLPPPSTTLLTTIFRLSYFLQSPSPAPLNTLKQCLFYDPDSKHWLALHRLLKSFERNFAELEELKTKEGYRGIMTLLAGPAAGKKDVFLNKSDEALKEHTDRTQILPLQLSEREHAPEIPLPDAFRTSIRRQELGHCARRTRSRR
ncbi:hypothetical protein H0H93_011945, partial [Arthromyces matolae]